MSFDIFANIIQQRMEPLLQEYGYQRITYPKLEYDVVFRKVMEPWFLFIVFRYNERLSLPGEHIFHIEVLRVPVDEPFSQFIYDLDGKYIEGALTLPIILPREIGWEYRTPKDLQSALEQATPLIIDHLGKLEDPQSSMGYS